MVDLPTAEALLGPAQDDETASASARGLGMSLPAANALLDAPVPESFGQHIADIPGAVARIAKAFGHGVEQGWGKGSLGLSPELQEWLQKVGVLPDVQKHQGGLIRDFNAALIEPAAAALDGLFRGTSALLRGTQAATAQTGTEAGAPMLGRDLAAMEGFLFQGGGETLALPHPAELPPEIGAAERLGVIGHGEDVARGMAAPKIAEPDEATRALVEAQKEQAANANTPGELPSAYEPGALGDEAAPPSEPYAPPMAPYSAAPTPPHNLDEAARQIDPGTFADYDLLSRRRDALRDEVASAQAELQASAEAQAPHAAEIADLQERLQDTTPRLAKKYEARLAELLPAHQAFLDDEFTMGALTRETPEIAALRDELMQADYRMRDLAPQVTAAYRAAAERFPHLLEPEVSPVAPSAPEFAREPASAETVPLPEAFAEPAAEQASQVVRPPVEPGPAAGSVRHPVPVPVAEDVANKLMAAGRPEEEARAAGELVTAHYEARAARLGGRRGTGAELYAAEAPDIRAGAVGGRGGRAAGKLRLREVEYAQRRAEAPVARITGDEIAPRSADLAQLRKAAREFYERELRGTSVESRALGKPVQFRSSRKAFSASANPDKLRMFAALRNIIGNGRLIESRAPEIPEVEKSTKAYHFLRADVQTPEGPRDVGVTVREDTNGHLYYNHALLDEGGSPGASKGYRGKAGPVPESGAGRQGTALDQGMVPDDDEINLTLDNPVAAEPRGRVHIAVRPLITLFARADASTFLHETAHAWLEELLGDAAETDAPADIARDAETVRTWLGAKEDMPVTTRQHEKFARGFERYLMEGVAPTRGLARVFAQFREWLTRIYQTVDRLRAPINDDIRDVFARLLAKEPERVITGAEEPTREAEPPGPERVLTNYRRSATPYAKAAREPLRLSTFLRRMGGVKDEGGDVAHMLGGARFRPGLINNGRGVPLDEAARRAWEAGYFPEHGGMRPTVNDLLDAIEEDLKHNPRYSHYDAAAAEAYRQALDHNAEIDRLADIYNIDPKGLTREQFFDRVAEKRDTEAEATQQEDAHEEAFGEGAIGAEDVLGNWPPEGEPVTLEDLENAYRQEAAAASAPAGETGAGDAGYAGGRAPGDEESGGPRGRGARAAGRDSAQAGAAARGPEGAGRSAELSDPQERFPDPEPRLIDKAGNIRLDNLDQPEDVNEVLREMAQRNGDFVAERRGVVSDADVLDMADAINALPADLNIGKLRQISLEDPYPLAARIRAGRVLLVQAANAVRDAAAKAVTGSDADAAAYAAASDKLRMIQATISGVTAEWGRAGRAFRILTAEERDAKELAAMTKAATGRTLFQLREQAQAALALETPAQLAKWARDETRPDFWDMLSEYQINNLISNPVTHATYALGNELLALWRAIPETAVAGAIGEVRRAVGSVEERVEWGELGAGLFGMLQGTKDGLRAAWEALKTGEPVRLPGERSAHVITVFRGASDGAIPNPTAFGYRLPIGTALRLPTRMVIAIHALARFQNYSMDIAQMAYRAAHQEGLDEPAFAARVAELRMNPTPTMMETARDQANRATLLAAPGEFTRAVALFRNARILGVPLLKFILPFVQVGSNILRQGLLERTPFGLLDPEIRAVLRGEEGPVARDTMAARLVVGSTLGALGVWMASQGHITGGGPLDPRERAAWRAMGNQPYSIRVGDTWYSFARLGPIAKPLSLAADLWEVGEAATHEDAGTVAGLTVGTFSHMVLDESWLRGLYSALSVVDGPQSVRDRWAADFAGGFVPFSMALGQLDRATDPYERAARGILDGIKRRMPGFSETLPARVDVWGQKVPQGTTLGGLGLTAIYTSQETNDPTIRALASLQERGYSAWPAMPRPEIRGVRLSARQYEDYATVAGRYAKMRVDGLVRMPTFGLLPPGRQAQMVRQTIAHARESVRALMMMRYPAIIRQAVANKRALLTAR